MSIDPKSALIGGLVVLCGLLSLGQARMYDSNGNRIPTGPAAKQKSNTETNNLAKLIGLEKDLQAEADQYAAGYFETYWNEKISVLDWKNDAAVDAFAKKIGVLRKVTGMTVNGKGDSRLQNNEELLAVAKREYRNSTQYQSVLLNDPTYKTILAGLDAAADARRRGLSPEETLQKVIAAQNAQKEANAPAVAAAARENAIHEDYWNKFAAENPEIGRAGGEALWQEAVREVNADKSYVNDDQRAGAARIIFKQKVDAKKAAAAANENAVHEAYWVQFAKDNPEIGRMGGEALWKETVAEVHANPSLVNDDQKAGAARFIFKQKVAAAKAKIAASDKK
ncbi:MAG: hypothetical protein FWD61_11610 [Phycisphaerales bacterium]|nr:hypothetical protein [Phycisphaerales bacterium]